MPAKFDMSDYVPVNERIEEFVTAHPEGSLQSEIVELTVDRVTVKAYAYRTPDDPRPGVGHSSLEIPGSTPYTRGSEIENAETSAWGRAIAALGFEVKRGIASSEEIRNKQPGQGVGPSRKASADPVPAPAQYRRAELAALLAELHLGESVAGEYAKLYGVAPGTRASDEQMDQIIEAVRGHATGEELVIESAADVPAAVEPEAGGSPSPAPAPPKPRTPEYGALSAQEKAAARAYWTERDKEARQPEPMNPEPETLGLSS